MTRHLTLAIQKPIIRGSCRVVLVGLWAGILIAGRLEADEAAQGAQYALQLEGALPDGKTLTLMLRQDNDELLAFGLGRNFNGRGYPVDATALRITRGEIRGRVSITVVPDPWVPTDHKARRCEFEIGAKLRAGQVSGTYSGSYGGEARQGPVSGSALPPFQPAGRYKLRLFQALRRGAPAHGFRGPNVDYALDMWLTFRIDEAGKAVDAQLETPVPDYRRYCALVDSIQVSIGRGRFKATVVADVDHGGQIKGTDDPGTRRSRYTYVLEGLAIGSDVTGGYEGVVGDICDKGIPLLGTINWDPPPEPENATALLRFHNAMQDDAPVVLFLSVSNGNRIHGLAYAPGYNHQPQTVDASRLKRGGNKIGGPITVSIYPDCYHDRDVFFDVSFELDATIQRGVIAGRFIGNDRGTATAGPVTGELREKQPPLAGPEGLAACEVTLGYGMPEGSVKSITLRYPFADGEPQTAVVLDARTTEPVTGITVTSSRIRFDGDAMRGTISLSVTGQGAGRYEYAFEAMVDGQHCSGFWRGKRDGGDILVKSAKLGGKLVVKQHTRASARPTRGQQSVWAWYGGPHYSGILADAQTVPDGENMKVLWKVRMLSTGHSGPAVVGEEVFILDRRGAKETGEDYLRVFDLNTCEQRWAFAYPAPGDCRQQSIGYMPHRAGPVSVPAVSDIRVFVTGARGRLYCIDRQTHDLIWSKQLNTPITHGAFSPSPLLVGDLVIVSYTTEGGDVLQALRVDDGEVAWAAQPELRREQEHGMVAVVHASPILATIFGERHVVATHKRVTFGVDPKIGKVLWQYEGYRRGSIQAEVAISPDGYMFFTSGHDGTSSLVHMTKDDTGYKFEVVYYDPQRDRHKTRAGSEWRPGQWWDGHLYHVSNHFASHGLLCMDKQGKVLWKTRVKDRKKRGPDFRYSCLTIINGIGLALNQGQLKVIHLNPKRYEELGSIDVFHLHEAEPFIQRLEDWNDRKWNGHIAKLAFSTWAKHAYVDGLFLTRNPQYLACVRVAEQ